MSKSEPTTDTERRIAQTPSGPSREGAGSPTESNRRIRLGSQLAILVLLLSVSPLLVTNLFGYYTSRRDTVELSLQSLRQSADLAALQTERLLEDNRRWVASIVADNTDLADNARRATSPNSGQQRAREALAHHLDAKTAETARTLQLVAITPDGRRIAGSSGRGDTAPDPCLRLAQSDAKHVFRRHEGEPTYFYLHPFPQGAQQPVGLLCATFRFDVHRFIGERPSSFGKAGETISLVGARGDVLARHGDEVDTRGAPLAAPLVDRLGDESRWSGRYEPSNQPAGFAAVIPVEGTPWSVVATLSEDRALASLDALRRRVTWLGGGLVLAILLGLGFTVRTTVGPIEDLVDAVRNLRQGALDQRVAVRGPREVASLAEAFNRMSDRIVALRDELEDRVRQRTRELEQSQAFTELLFDSLNESLVVVDENREILKANSAAEQLYGPDLEGSPYWRAFEDRDRPCDSCLVEEVLETNESVATRRVHACRDGAEIVDLEGFPLPKRQGESGRRVLLVGRIVTEETREEQQLIHQEKMAAVGALSAGMAHEIGNPLASIESQLQTARRLDDPEVTEETLEVIEQEVDRMGDLLRGVSSFARRRDSTEARISLNHIVEDVTRLLEHNPRGRDAELEFDLEESLPAVRADENRLLQVLLNLGLNAFAALDDSGTVRFETFADDETVALRVRDSGPGVPSSVRDRIFHPYFTTKADDDGTGLGLFVSRRIVRDLGGEIELEPPAEHRGASFVVRLPVDGTDEGGGSHRSSDEEHDHD